MNERLLLRTFKKMRTVQRVENWSTLKHGSVNFVFFFCPRMKSGGFWVNQEGTGLEAKYVPGISGFSAQRIGRVRRFQHEYYRLTGNHPSITAIFASADSVLLFPKAVPAPEIPSEKDVGFALRANLTAFLRHRNTWESLLSRRSWEKVVPQHVLDAETKRLSSLVGQMPKELADDFVRRVFAGFALDGLMLRSGALDIANPVLLGVESPGVPVMQNAALSPTDRIPVIQLR